MNDKNNFTRRRFLHQASCYQLVLLAVSLEQVEVVAQSDRMQMTKSGLIALRNRQTD